MGCRRLWVPLTVMVALAGCDDDDDDVDIGRGSVTGRVESTTTPFAAVAPGRFVTQQLPATTATTAVVGRFDSDGNLTVQASADVGADARFLVNNIIANQLRLVAEVRDASDNAVGRSIVHTGPEDNQTVAVAAINGETTAEANVLAELRSRGTSSQSIATPEITAKIEFTSSAEASAAAVNTAEIDALADAFSGAQAAFIASLDLTDQDVDAQFLQLAAVGAAQLFADLRDDGTAEGASEQAFLEALAEGYAEAGLDFEAQSIAGSAASAAGFDATADASAALAVLRGAGSQMAAARALLAIDALAGLGASQASLDAVADARIALDAQLSGATTTDAVLDAFETFEAAVLAEFEEVAQAQLGLSAASLIALELAVAGADFQAALASALAAASDTDAIVDAFADFYAALRNLVVGTLTAAGVADADAQLAADVFVAAESGLDAFL